MTEYNNVGGWTNTVLTVMEARKFMIKVPANVQYWPTSWFANGHLDRSCLFQFYKNINIIMKTHSHNLW
jgi:hypothetical protein